MGLMLLHHFFNPSSGKYEVASPAVDAIIRGAKSHLLLDRKPTPRGGVTPGPTLTLLFLSRPRRATHHGADRPFGSHDVTPRTPVSHALPTSRLITPHVVPLDVVGLRYAKLAFVAP